MQLTGIDWMYKTVPQNRSCLGLKNRQSNWPRGRVLGGSSVLNYMLYVRGNSRDYDKVRESYGKRYYKGFQFCSRATLTIRFIQ